MAARKLMTIFGMTGAVGQAAILINSLVDCYPYKMMSNPSYRFCEGIAFAGTSCDHVFPTAERPWLVWPVRRFFF